MENSGHSFTEGMEGSEPIKLTERERIKLEREHKYKRMDTIYQHNITILKENQTLKEQLKQRDETIKQLKEALGEVLDYWESHEPPTYHNTAYYNARKLLS